MDAMTTANTLPNRARQILEDALAAFTKTTALQANVVNYEPLTPANFRADAWIQIGEPGRYHEFFAEIKNIDRTATLGTVKERFPPFDHQQGLLVTPYLTPELAHHCRQIDLPFIDTAGNTYLHAPGLFIFVTGEKRPKRADTIGARGGGTATAIRVVFALLCRPELLNAPYRDIVDAAAVALGAVGWIFFDLERRGFVAGRMKKGKRQFLDRQHLIDEWVTNYPTKLRPKLNARRFRAPDAGWWNAAQLPTAAYWGGEIAADRLTNYLKPATATIYMDPRYRQENLATLVRAHRLQADPAGDIEVLDTFWNFGADLAHPGLVPPLLIYADLVATRDTRNLATARLIRERYLDDVLRQP